MKTKRVIFVGDSSHHEFRDAVAWLREYCELTLCDSFAAASQELLPWPDPPSAIVLAQLRPGTVQQSDIERLRIKTWPTPLIALLGGWCEGELRTGRPLSGVTRVSWHRFVPQIGPSLQRAPSRNAVAAQTVRHGLVVIRSTSRDSYEALSEACNAIGHSTVWLARHRHLLATRPDFGIWDCQGDIAGDRQALSDFVCQVNPAPVVAVLGFPRGDDYEAALACGATSVISKPYAQSELWSTLASVNSVNRRAA